MKFLNVSCLLGCSEAVLSLNTGEGQETHKKRAGAGDKDKDERLDGVGGMGVEEQTRGWEGTG